VFIPPGAHRARSVALLRDSEIMGAGSGGKDAERILRRVRPPALEAARPLIASSARIVAVPGHRPRAARAA
jgi:hypothetical protein